jgi:hypothetical protein
VADGAIGGGDGGIGLEGEGGCRFDSEVAVVSGFAGG